MLSYVDCSIRVYQSFTTIFHKCLILLLILYFTLPIMLALSLMLSMTHNAQNYAGIIGGSLATYIWAFFTMKSEVIYDSESDKIEHFM